MQINWKVRFRNKVWLSSVVAFAIATVYQAFSLFEVIPPVEQSQVMDIASTALQLLSLLGIIVDPTTAGLSDSRQALDYSEPRQG